jgi:sterol desaturase/sphingolipid hydroxylase (fatty acid hydroxylase superfamily)
MDHLARSPVWLAIVVVLILVEFGWRRWSGHGYDGRTALTTFGLAAGNIVAAGINAVAIGSIYAALWRIAPLRWPLEDWRSWAVGFVLVEFVYYWFHRASHRVAWLWATHAVHHSAEQLTLLSSLRLGWSNLLSGGWLFYAPLVLAGFDPRLIVTLLAFDLHFQFFLHTEAVGGLGPLEQVLNTPAHHRLHHASNAAYLDHNYGGVVILFDRLFGTFGREIPGETIRYGLAHRAPSRNPLRLVLGEWMTMARNVGAARGPRAKLAAAFGPPA